MTLSIVIPCYNESGNIPLIINRLTDILEKESTQAIEIVLVDNGSTDNSPEIFKRELSAARSEFKLLRIEKNQGYGFGILSGLNVATGDILSWTHADMQTDPFDVITAFKQYKNTTAECVFVKGRRKNRAFLDAFFSWGMQVLSSIILKVPLSDINAQPKLFSRLFYTQYVSKDAPHDFSLDLFVLYQAKKHAQKIIEIPVDFAKRIHGEAKGGGSWKTRIKLIKRTVIYIFKLALEINKKTV